MHEVDAPHEDLVTMAIVDIGVSGCEEDVNVVHEVDAPHADLVVMVVLEDGVDIEDCMVL